MARRFNQFALVAAPVGTAGAVVDDPVVKTASFTAKQGVRYFIGNTSLPFTMTMPPGPTNGMLVGVTATRVYSGGLLTISAPGVSVETRGANAASITISGYNLDNLLFRYDGGFGKWIEVSAGLSSYNGSMTSLPALWTRSPTVNGGAVADLSPGVNTLIGRDSGNNIRALQSYEAAHLLDDSAGAITDASTGSQSTWLNSVEFQRAHTVNWEGASDLIVRGLFSNKTGTGWRNDKVIHNATGQTFFGGNKNIIWKNEDTGAGNSVYRIVHEGAPPSTDFADYVQGPGQTVRLRYNTTYDRWYLQGERPSGHIDRRITTTDAVATIIHTHQTNLANRVIAYKVQVEALETAGTPGRAALYDIAALFHRDGAGLIVQKGATAFMASIEDNAAWDVTFTPVGTTIEMKVTGDGTDTVRWRVVGNITEHG